jgi:CRISPR-associated endonuclease/helicase Cas3
LKPRPVKTEFWAKLERDADETPRDWLSLRAHSADVAACVEKLLQVTILGDRLATLLGFNELNDGHVARLAALAALHDIGKVNNGFQARFDPSPDQWAGHVSPAISLLGSKMGLEVLEALQIEPILDWFESQSKGKAQIDALCATWAHHGRPVSPDSSSTAFDDRLWSEHDQNAPLDGVQQIAESIRKWYPRAFKSSVTPFPDVPAFRHAYNGLLNLADWLGSDTDTFPFDRPDDHLIEIARERASETIADKHLDPRPARRALGPRSPSFQDAVGFEPYDIQQACFDLSIDPNGNLTVLESDTGSGKTEAAIARFIRLFHAGEVDGMYFAVPTRSAAKQLQDRVRGALADLFPDQSERPPVVLAVPGYVRVDNLDGDPHALPGYDVQWPDERTDAQQRGWAAESSKRYLAGAVAVGTVDQVLLSALQVNHAHLRATSLHRHLLVVDEIHSSAPYMRRVLQKVLDHHLEAGGHAMLMSATLGTTDRISYTTGRHAEPLSIDEATEQDYPLVTHVDGSRTEPTHISAESSDYEKSIQLNLKPWAAEATSIARRALSYARDGARVLVIRNVVKDCIDTQEALEALAGPDSSYIFQTDGTQTPHHSRFAANDRRALDDGIEATFGKQSDQDSVVAVATQTVEQSLDIDADVMLTDLAPADVLLQRIGRLHRHPSRHRPRGFEGARIDVLVPEERDLSNGIVESGDEYGSGLAGDHGLGTVYNDLRVLETTWRQLEQDDQWRIPHDNRRLVERTTHPERLEAVAEELGDLWLEHQRYVLGERLGEEGHSELVTIDRDEPFIDNGFVSDIDHIKTRLGNDDWQIDFQDPPDGPLDRPVESLSIPDYWLHDVGQLQDDDLIAESVRTDENSIHFSVAGHRFRYDRLGLRPDDTTGDTT